MTAQILLSLSILVGLHELGHLVAAKVFGMRVEQFSIGFPPKIFGVKWRDTEYSIGAIPLGGFVKISGMIDESLDTDAMKEEPKEWEFRSKPAWQRLIVMLGGIIVNVILGIVIFICLTYFVGDQYLSKDEVNRMGGIEALEIGEQIGLQDGDKFIKINGSDFQDFQEVLDPNNLLEDNAFYTVERNGKLVDVAIPSNFIEYMNSKENMSKFFTYRVPALVDKVHEGTFAERIGIKEGDKFVKLNGVDINSFSHFKTTLQDNKKDSIEFTLLREGELLSFKEDFSQDTIIGFSTELPQFSTIEYGFVESIGIGTNKAFGIVFVQLKAFKKIFSGDLSVRKSLSGPIRIASAYGGDWQWERFWRMTGLLSMVLAFMNLLPIPALDGGHVVFLGFEIISGKKPSDKFLENAQKVGMVMLLSLMVFVFANDIYTVLIQPLFN